MRAGYAAVLLAVAITAAIGSVALPAEPTTPSTVAATLALDELGSTAALDRRREAAIEVLTARCMTRNDLPYEPNPAVAPVIPDAALDPLRWAARWGFGVSTAVGYQPVSAQPDPNQAYAATLPSAQRERYLGTLLGDGTGSGCRASATERVMGLRDRLLAPLRGELDALRRRIDADPAVHAAALAWRRCVTSGTGVADPDRATLGPRLIERYAAVVAAGVRGTGLVLVQAEERTVATAVARCDLAFIDARTRAGTPYEARFVRRHGPRLRAIGAAIRDLEAALPTIPP